MRPSRAKRSPSAGKGAIFGHNNLPPKGISLLTKTQKPLLKKSLIELPRLYSKPSLQKRPTDQIPINQMKVPPFPRRTPKESPLNPLNTRSHSNWNKEKRLKVREIRVYFQSMQASLPLKDNPFSNPPYQLIHRYNLSVSDPQTERTSHSHFLALNSVQKVIHIFRQIKSYTYIFF